MILCDLPYGTTACKWDTIIPFADLWAHYERVIKSNGAIVLTAAQPFSTVLGASKIGLLKYQWYWRKTRATGHLNAKKMPMKDVEDVLVFYSKQPTFNPQGTRECEITKKNTAGRLTAQVYGSVADKDHLQTTTNYPRQVLDFASVHNGGEAHPTQKPVALFEYLIRTYTNPGELVLDNCAGSCTTAIAALNTGRNYLCIEQEEKYVTIARARVAALQPTLSL